MNIAVIKKRSMHYIPIIGLLLIFLIPIICAKLFLSDPNILQNLGNTSAGKWLSEEVLIQNNYANWLLIILKDQVDQQEINKLTNLHIALGKYQKALVIDYLSSSSSTLKLREQNYQALIEYNHNQLSNAQYSPTIFIADPSGRVLISYSKFDIGKPLLKDLKKFIKLTSSI